MKTKVKHEGGQLQYRLQRERYIRMLVADGQGPSISYRKGPMYVSIYMSNYSVEGPLISQQFLNVVFRKQSDLKM